MSISPEAWIAALLTAADAIYKQDGGLASNETGWRDDELREAWMLIHAEIARLEKL